MWTFGTPRGVAMIAQSPREGAFLRMEAGQAFGYMDAVDEHAGAAGARDAGEVELLRLRTAGSGAVRAALVLDGARTSHG